ncbi:MAG: hypothetical protein JXD21_08450 [Candidatus Omnitrophica bacterium]|nr:hypothetical protein [Candidatus Omnitrophota bacterium]
MNRKQSKVIWGTLVAICIVWVWYAIRYDLFGSWRFWGLKEPDTFLSGIDALLSLSIFQVVTTFVFHFLIYIIPLILIAGLLVYRLKDRRVK